MKLHAPEPVRAWTEDLAIPTYLPAPPDKNPMFLEKRVYQGSNGKVYPLPFTDRIAEKPVDRRWKAVGMENEFLRAIILPELGGRIHALVDKTNGYDLIYRQPVIKPALVGLAGPWISGGIEFNWPQHHRPTTFLPIDWDIEEHADGAKTIWCSEHDPMARMKGMHGVCLHPGRACLELKVRVYNRTPFVQTFLWWANVATRVHESYQSFFPPDVYCVADHARRSMSAYPLAQGSYYGVDFGARARRGIPEDEVPRQFVPPHCQKAPARRERAVVYRPNDLSYYANIPTPCSYMCIDSQGDFFGGYDHKAQAGLVHVAEHHISPGKKQWTWGNHDFGYAWDRNLTEPDPAGQYPPYIELMAGVFTDNQPDFSFLQPGETKSWNQYWYPIQKIGPPQQANLDAAVSLRLTAKHVALGICATRHFPKVLVRLERSDGSAAAEWDAALEPGRPFVLRSRQARVPWKVGRTVMRILDGERREIISYAPQPRVKARVPAPATEPLPPGNIKSADELYLTGLHLRQYRHATRSPVPYWEEALRRDPLDSRCNNALGLWCLERGEFAEAEAFFRKALRRLTTRNPNPYDGEPYYNLGLCLRYRAGAWPAADEDHPGAARGSHAGVSQLQAEAYAAFYKATWNQAWAAAGYHALAELDCVRHNWSAALAHLEHSLQLNSDNLRARNLKVLALRRAGNAAEAQGILQDTLRLDRLDWWAHHLAGHPLKCDLQTRLDLAHDYSRAGFLDEATEVLRLALEAVEPTGLYAQGELLNQNWGAVPLVTYTLAWLELNRGKCASALRRFKAAAACPPDYCFPSRLEEIAVLETAIAVNPKDARAHYYLGNLCYDRRRHSEAIRLWTRAAELDPRLSIAWRNLGIGYYNIRRDRPGARRLYEKAFRANPADARLLYERDQLWKRLRVGARERWRELQKYPRLVQQRDDLSLEFCALLNQLGDHRAALAFMSGRRFQPWEGGEGGLLREYTRAHVALGREALRKGDACRARELFQRALAPPENLGEARHLHANQSELDYWLGCALSRLGDQARARKYWSAAARREGDFLEMKQRPFSEVAYYSGRAWARLGRPAHGRKLFRQLLAYARNLYNTPAKIDYFATSLPTMLLFEDDLQARQEATALFLQAQALFGLGQTGAAKRLLRKVLLRDPGHAWAADFKRELDRAQSRSR